MHINTVALVSSLSLFLSIFYSSGISRHNRTALFVNESASWSVETRIVQVITITVAITFVFEVRPVIYIIFIIT